MLVGEGGEPFLVMGHHSYPSGKSFRDHCSNMYKVTVPVSSYLLLSPDIQTAVECQLGIPSLFLLGTDKTISEASTALKEKSE